jgi:hypothetical protein
MDLMLMLFMVKMKKRTYEALYPTQPDSEKPDFHHLELF